MEKKLRSKYMKRIFPHQRRLRWEDGRISIYAVLKIASKSGISSANLAGNRQRWVREHPMERRNKPTTVELPSG